jgi:hypothetical protein
MKKPKEKLLDIAQSVLSLLKTVLELLKVMTGMYKPTTFAVVGLCFCSR